MPSTLSNIPNYEFSALRGIQAGREYFMVMCPLGVLTKVFTFNGDNLSPEDRAQRTLDTGRVPRITRYIVENLDSYTFSALTASIVGDYDFIPLSTEQLDVGRLRIPVDAQFLINDGQHRRAAIEEAIKAAPQLRHETISVVMYPDGELKRSQQIFADLNKHAVRPTTSLGIFYDHRDGLSALARHLTETVPWFKGTTEVERNTISFTSRKLFTLSAIHKATAKFLGKTSRDGATVAEAERTGLFWTQIGNHMPAWQAVLRGDQHAGQLRRDEIQTHALTLQALAIAGSALIVAHPEDWATHLSPLQQLNWRRDNSIWSGRALVAGRLVASRSNILLTSNILKQTLGLTLNDEEQALEKAHEQAGAADGPA